MFKQVPKLNDYTYIMLVSLSVDEFFIGLEIFISGAAFGGFVALNDMLLYHLI